MMRYILIGLCLIVGIPYLVMANQYATTESVARPAVVSEGSVDSKVSSYNSVLEQLSMTLQSQGATGSVTVDTPPSIQVVTEIGNVSIPLSSGHSDVVRDTPNLASVVDKINTSYVINQTACRTGFWLERLWCKMSSWW